MVVADHPHVLGQVVAQLVKRIFEGREYLRPVQSRTDVHWMRDAKVQGRLVRELGHLDVDACVDFASKVGAQHLAVRRVFPEGHPNRLRLEIPLHALGAHGSRQ